MTLAQNPQKGFEHWVLDSYFWHQIGKEPHSRPIVGIKLAYVHQ